MSIRDEEFEDPEVSTDEMIDTYMNCVMIGMDLFPVELDDIEKVLLKIRETNNDGEGEEEDELNATLDELIELSAFLSPEDFDNFREKVNEISFDDACLKSILNHCVKIVNSVSPENLEDIKLILKGLKD